MEDTEEEKIDDLFKISNKYVIVPSSTNSNKYHM